MKKDLWEVDRRKEIIRKKGAVKNERKRRRFEIQNSKIVYFFLLKKYAKIHDTSVMQSYEHIRT